MPQKQEEEVQEQKYFERLNISVLSISRIKSLIKGDIKGTLNAWQKGRNVQKQCFHIIGPAGVGKTDIAKQIARELTEELQVPFDMIMVKAPVLSRDDFIIPFPIVDNGNTSFKMLYSDFVPKGKESYGLFVIDECSRGDHALQQLLWQVQNEYKVHLQEFPKNWFVVTIDNPDDSEYQMDTMEDAAGLRRQLHIYVEVNAPDFLHYAIEQKFHPVIIEFIQTHPDFLYDWDAQKLGAVYANPASYEKLSDQLWKFELNGKIEAHFPEIESLSSGLLNVSMTSNFMSFLKEGKGINPKDIFFDYAKVRPKILAFKQENDNASLGEVMMSFLTYMTTSRPEYEQKEKQNVAQFLVDLPIDTAAIYVTDIDSLDRKTPEFKYVTRLHSAMLKIPEYKIMFYEAIVKVGRENE